MATKPTYPIVDTWQNPKEVNDYYSPISISLDELIECGAVDFAADDMRYDYYSETQFDTLNAKIIARFGMRDISIIPVGRWKQQFVRLMNELMPKYKLWYKIIDDDVDLLQDTNTYEKSRSIFSDFPQTQLAGNSDYASNGTDYEREIVTDGNFLDVADRIRRYNDVDVMILDELEQLFSSLIAVNVNAY